MDAQQIEQGTPVRDSTGEQVGTVHEYHAEGGYFVMHKGWLFPKDVYVPTSAINNVDAEGVRLRLHKNSLAGNTYDQPPPAGAADPARQDAGQGRPRASRAVARDVEATGDLVVPVFEEQLVVGKQVAEEGRVHIRKEVVEQPVSVSVSTQHEHLTVERFAFSGDPDAADAFVARDIEVPLMGEQAVVGKQVVGVEEVRVHKDVVAETRQITDTVRKEHLVVQEQAAGERSGAVQGAPARGKAKRKRRK